jgi:hypothetical protein
MSAVPSPVIAARDIPYIRNANRHQNLSIYLPRTRKPPGSLAPPSCPSQELTPRRVSPGSSCTSTAAPGPARTASGVLPGRQRPGWE